MDKRGAAGFRPLRRVRLVMSTRHTRKLLASGLGVIALACLWYCFAPVALGGSTTYVVTDGISMQPRFHAGDLVLVRGQSDYRVGQIVAYNSDVFHTVVLHRIIARDGSRYVFKGDNNNFVDFEHPAQSQLIGALWMHIPGAGARLKSVRSPALIALLFTAATLLLAGGVFVRRRRRRGRQRRAEGGAQSSTPRLPRSFNEPLAGILTIGLLALLPFVALALLAFTRAPSSLRPATIPYKQSGTLSYSADASPGPTYDGDRAVTGDALFTHVVHNVDLRFDYLFHAEAKHSLRGRLWLDATIASTTGWQTTLALGRPVSFRGDRARLAASLSVPALLSLMRRVEDSTAVKGSYTLTLVPHVSAAGRLDTLALHATYSPRIQFSLDPLELQPLNSAGGTLASQAVQTNDPKSSASPFTPSEAGSAMGRRSQPLFLSLKVARLSVSSARWIALGGIAVIVLALLALIALARPREREESETIRTRYGRVIVPVERVWQLPGVAVIDVADMEALARIAERYDRSILHERTADGDAFWVTDESGQFRYAIGVSEPVTIEQDAVAPMVEAGPIIEYPAEPFEPAAEQIVEYAPEPAPPVYEPQPAPEITASAPAVDDWAAHEAADAIVREWRAGWNSADVTRGVRSPV
jgi:signal peptidase I